MQVKFCDDNFVFSNFKEAKDSYSMSFQSIGFQVDLQSKFKSILLFQTFG